ncbi:hypothetical protein ACQKJG_06440 [Priestia megaterium]|nr:hypothetical protein [Priestia megaterium]
MEYSFTIGLFVVISIATVGHYILESILRLTKSACVFKYPSAFLYELF